MSGTNDKICLACQTPQSEVKGPPNFARGLCHKCHDYHRQRGTLEQFPRITWKADELVAEAELLLRHGASREEVAKRLGVKWPSIVSARQRLRDKAKRKESSTLYEEHVKLEKIARLSQSIGEFIEWLGTEGVQLMRWTVTTDIRTCQGTLMRDCRGEYCVVCKGANIVEVKDERWLPYGMSISDMLAKFFDIDQNKIEMEKRHMLETLRQQQHKE